MDNNTKNDNAEQVDAVTLELARLIDRHSSARETIARLKAIHHHYKASPVNCDLVVRCLDQATQAEGYARNELLVCKVNTVQQAANKAVYLRNLLLQDEAENAAEMEKHAGDANGSSCA
ncbi:hypothetical protein [Phyllobacterium sp. YR531]|uniref:hypothetical protein n=1 Tax=Phyllobacterium sp. YR531 TaxID=1144343 RepID=UPI00026FB2BA|nr:hypothetical protein [Phyllobacterium sp. YR531]EJN00352.1 hypothetical protein PMI41_03680 [Phyllobacterium sp. YR531]